ncbi:hypothetical protein [Dysgonomonas sp. ZJ279]|uniref:hypothetical protein n=1 Tax=Dysgonomonas sp. ZJ279 TaxID=2709796 RepID=UPI0021031BC1|nr:hypothetical protein [Dysgonomonas sp. ZJ279]
MKKILIIAVAIIFFTLAGKAQNIYNTDGILIGNRTITMNTNSLTFLNEGSALSVGNSSQMSGFLLKGSTGGKFLDKGVGLEFALPADTDGSNFWSFGRIMTVPGNTYTRNATGKMVFGTRRMFNKYNSGSQWYFGDDLTIDGVGNIGIGTLTPQSKLDVRGKIIADEVQIKVNTGADFVFESEYNLKPLSEVEQFVKTNKHLPEIPSEKQMIEEGVNVTDMQIKLLQKIEELTLYMIEQDKKIEELKEQLNNK